MNPRIIALIAVTVLIFITASATTYNNIVHEQVPIDIPVRFFKQEYASTSAGGAAMAVPFDNLSSALKPLPASFEISRRWNGVENWADQGVSLWTIMKSGEVVQYGFNSSEPVVMSLISGADYVQVFHTDSTSTYYGTFKSTRNGLYVFDFSFYYLVERSVNATISFRCNEATNLEAINALHAVSFNTTAVQVNATREDSPSIANPRQENPGQYADFPDHVGVDFIEMLELVVVISIPVLLLFLARKSLKYIKN